MLFLAGPQSCAGKVLKHSGEVKSPEVGICSVSYAKGWLISVTFLGFIGCLCDCVWICTCVCVRVQSCNTSNIQICKSKARKKEGRRLKVNWAIFLVKVNILIKMHLFIFVSNVTQTVVCSPTVLGDTIAHHNGKTCSDANRCRFALTERVDWNEDVSAKS